MSWNGGVKKTKLYAVLLVAAAALGLPAALFLATEGEAQRAIPEARLASARALESSYLVWRANFERGGGDRNMTVALGYSKGHSIANTGARGLARLDLVGGFARVEVEGLTTPGAWEVWLVDNQEGPGRSAMPDPGDRMHRLGALKRTGARAALAATVPAHLFADFDVDMVVVAPAGKSPAEAALLYGAPSLFQRLYRREHQPGTRASHFPGMVAGLLSPRPAFADTPFNSLDPLVAQGADLFFNEKFAGNGRNCSTCHPAENNFTIDPLFIANLPANDPLFVADNNPALHGLENGVLLRELGLVTVNADGFEADHPAVFRAVQHLLGLSRYLVPGNQAVPPEQRTGWGGDGAPGSGTLREFPIGAITQHLTKNLARTPGTHFRLPTDQELDALEAFLLVLGRQDFPDIENMLLNSAAAERGRELFLSEKSQCTFCHINAGANGPFDPEANRNFDIGIEAMIDHPADLLQPGVRPPDGGFGRTPLNDLETGEFLGFGDFDPEEDGNMRRFNSQPAIEAVDTGPFFHNHAVQTVEESVDFYNSDAFAASLAGGLAIHLETTEVEHVAAFMRVMNALENIRSATELAHGALEETDPATARRLAELASFDAQDGNQVLQERRLHPLAAFRLSRAYLRLKDASLTAGKAQRDFFVNRALALMGLARQEMVLVD
jgi:cytochrome c peroxidase